MVVCALEVRLYLPGACSLKDKRRVLRSLVDQVRHRFNVSVAETDDQDLHQSIVIGLACVSGSGEHARHSLDTVVRWIEDHCEAEVVSVTDVMPEPGFWTENRQPGPGRADPG